MVRPIDLYLVAVVVVVVVVECMPAPDSAVRLERRQIGASLTRILTHVCLFFFSVYCLSSFFALPVHKMHEVLLPWNAFISAKHYFTRRLCDEDTGRPVIESIEGYFSIIYNGASVVSLAVVILIQYLTDDGNTNNSTVGIGDSNTVTTSTTTMTPSSKSPGFGCTPSPPLPAATTMPTSRRKLLKKSSSSTVSAILYSTKNIMMSPMSTKSLRVDATPGSANYTWYMVMLPLAVYLAVFCMTTVLVFVPDIPPTVFSIFTLSGLFICGVCTAAATSGIVGTAGLFDSSIGVNPYFNGQAVGGLLVSMANLLARFGDGSLDFFIEFCGSVMKTKGLGDYDHDGVEVSISMPEAHHDDKCVPYSDISWATAGYFAMSCFILSACILGYSYIDEYKQVVRRNSLTTGPAANYSSVNTNKQLPEQVPGDGNENAEGSFKPLLVRHLSMDANFADDVSDDDDVVDGQQDVSKWRKKASVTFSSYQHDEKDNNFGLDVEDFDRLSTTGSDTSETTQQTLTASIWYSVKGTAVCLFLVYFCTLGIFPVWTTELISAHQCQSSSRFQNDLFTPLSFVIFNVGDLAGRTMSSAIDLTKARGLSSKLVWGSVLRMSFFVAFLFCQAQHNRFFKWVIQSDIWSWSLQFIFAWTNGLMTNIAFCYAPTLVENKTNPQQMASAILNFALSFGLLVGSFFAYPYLSFAGNHFHGHSLP